MTRPTRQGPLDVAPLAATVGTEYQLGSLTKLVSEVVAQREWPVIGAVHITCADEAQHRVIDVFQDHLVEPHVTPLASGDRTAFRLVNLGGHHEPGALSIAEDHWAGAHEPGTGPKLMVARVDAHVGVTTDEVDGHRRYGRFQRYNRSSAACGALEAVLRGVAMRGSEGFVDSEVRARRITDRFGDDDKLLAAAICRAELSALDIMNEAARMTAASPTVWLLVATVTLNHTNDHSSVLTSVRVLDDQTVIAEKALGVDVDSYEITSEPTTQFVVARSGSAD